MLHAGVGGAARDIRCYRARCSRSDPQPQSQGKHQFLSLSRYYLFVYLNNECITGSSNRYLDDNVTNLYYISDDMICKLSNTS